MSFVLSPPNLPLVTIGVPVYNGAEHLRTTMNSLLSQDYPRLEIIISDNGSTDNTGEIAQQYANTYPNIRYIRHPENMGASANFTSLIYAATGIYFMWAATHDKWSSTLISSAVKALEADPEVVLAYATPYWIDQNGVESPIATTLMDTRTSPKGTRLVLTVWGLTVCSHYYGVHRLETLKKVMPCRKMFGPDTYILADLACKGSFALLPEEQFYMRQLGDFNDWSSYFRKLDMKLGPNSARDLYWEFILAHLQLVRAEFPKWTEQIPLAINMLSCMLTKYSWIPKKVNEAYEQETKRASGLKSSVQPCLEARR